VADGFANPQAKKAGCAQRSAFSLALTVARLGVAKMIQQFRHVGLVQERLGKGSRLLMWHPRHSESGVGK
jgi:hypothetical protein